MSESSYERWKIRSFDHWAVYLHAESPSYLGRVYIWLLREEVDLMDITPEEQEELFAIGRQLKTVLKQLFQVDHFNWAALGNVAVHCHVHVIPRYKVPREFEGITFVDNRWGKNYVPYDRDFQVPEEVLEKLRDTIATELQ